MVEYNRDSSLVGRTEGVDMIREFQWEYGFLSNFWLCPVEYDFETYKSVEHAYQCQKFIHYPEIHNLIRNLDKPGKAKREARKYKDNVRKDWRDINLQLMYELVKDKFTRTTNLRERLLATKDHYLQEGNYWEDTFFGVDLATGKGENHLGKILMRVRGELRGEI